MDNLPAVENKKRPTIVQMVPLRRCGSHALRLRLNLNKEFYSPYPIHLVDFMPLVEKYCQDLSDDSVYFQLIRDLIGVQDALMVRWGDVAFDPVDIFDRIKDEKRSVLRIAMEMLIQAGQRHNASVVMEKSLDNIHYADELIDLFPDMRFLNVVRDPRAQIDSMNRAIIHRFDTLPNTRIWVKAYDAVRRLEKMHPEKVMTVRFEDFLADAEAVMRRISLFLGIEFAESMLDVGKSVEAHKLAHLSSLWESNAFPPVLANAEKFRKNMSPEEIELIETLTGEHMDYFGYERMTKGAVTITPEMERAALERDQRNERQAWADLKANKPHDYILRRFRADTIAMIGERLENRPWK